MLKFKGTYEIISPEDIGLARANESGIVLGKLRYGNSCNKAQRNKQIMPISFGSCICSSALIFIIFSIH